MPSREIMREARERFQAARQRLEEEQVEQVQWDRAVIRETQAEQPKPVWPEAHT